MQSFDLNAVKLVKVIMRAAVNAGLAEAYPGLPGAEGLPALAANMYR